MVHSFGDMYTLSFFYEFLFSVSLNFRNSSMLSDKNRLFSAENWKWQFFSAYLYFNLSVLQKSRRLLHFPLRDVIVFLPHSLALLSWFFLFLLSLKLVLTVQIKDGAGQELTVKRGSCLVQLLGICG